MSQMTATARPLRTPRRGPAPTPLRVIPSSISRTGNGVFAAICIALLAAGLITLLLLNTALAQGSLALGDLQRESVRLSDTTGNLQEQIATASSTGALAASAARLGLVRMNTRGYIDLRTGTVSGSPEPATSQNAFPVFPGMGGEPSSVSTTTTSTTTMASPASTAPSSTPNPSTVTGAPAPAATHGSTPAMSATPTGAGVGAHQPAPSTLVSTSGAASGKPGAATSSHGGQAQHTTAR